MKTLHWDAINPATGTPYTWDDPNLRWGSPSYILEPGDPGYTPPPGSPPLSASKTKTRNKMKRQDYYPSRISDQAAWLENLRNKIAAYILLLGASPTKVNGIVLDCRWVVYLLLSYLPATKAWASACVQAVTQAQTGPGGPLTLPLFVPPELPDGVVPRDEGALNRVFDFVSEIKEVDACGPAVCADLRIIGPEQTGPDFATFRPDLNATATPAGVVLGWGWQGFSKFLDQLEINVDRLDGKGWQILTFDTTPNYTDTHPTPATLTQWKYRAIFRLNDLQVGLWSETVSVVVGA